MKRSVLAPLLILALFSACSDTPASDDDFGPDASGDAGVDAKDMGTPDLVQLGEFTTADEAFSYVDPLIGSGGSGFAYAGMTPAAQVPNGMVKIGPDTTKNGAHSPDIHHFSGYYYGDPEIRGFSHLHLVGTGTADYGNLRVLPNTQDNLQNKTPGQWWLTHDRTQEEAEPGYYSTRLEEADVQAEFTATKNAAIHRYTFGSTGPHFITLDLAASVRDSGVTEAAITANGKTIEGWVDYKGDYVGRSIPMVIYFAATYSVAPDASYIWDANGIDEAATLGQDVQLGSVARFDSLSAPLELRVGVSLISEAQAKLNLEQAAGSFEDVQAAVRALWIEKLERIRVKGGTEKDRKTFFTALYNTYRMPTRFDEDGQYRGLDGLVHPVNHPYYTELSLWDSYRTAHPWFTFYEPEMQRDVLRSLMLMNSDGGHIPRWPAGLSYTGGMIGTPADALFGESAIKGIEGIDYDAALDALIASHSSLRDDLDLYALHGYIPADIRTESAALTLEYAVHDQGLATLAGFLGRPEAATYETRSDSYKNLWNADSQFFQAKNLDGSWEEPFRPSSFSGRSGGPYIEGSAWHWLFHAQHDPEGLRDVMSAEVMELQLDELFEGSKHFESSKLQWSIPDSHYWHGNQPPLASAFMYAVIGRLDKLGMWVRKIQNVFYDVGPDGIAGNDDGGTLSSWLLFSAVGFYPVVSTDRYAPSPPLFPSIEITLLNQQKVIVLAPEAPSAFEIQKVMVDQAELSQWYLTHDMISNGAVINYELE